MRPDQPPHTSNDLLDRYERGERDFCAAVLSGDMLAGAKLSGANFADGVLGGSNLDGADLSNDNLRGANLDGASLRRAVLRGADLTGSSLRSANLAEADLTGANFGEATIGNTLLLDVDLSALCEARPAIRHTGPSTVDFRSIIKSIRSVDLKPFLVRTGMPELFVEYNISCAQSVSFDIMKRFLQSTFISYGGPDEMFARRLYDALHRNGVTTYFFAAHAIPGEKLHHLMRDRINEHDRIILICSKASLDRPGLLNEIEEALAREAREGGAALLIPIRLDDYVFSGWRPRNSGTAQTVRDRVVADFRGADRDSKIFEDGVMRLLRALKK